MTRFPYRHVGGGKAAVELQLQGVVPPVQGADSLGPDGGDVVPLVELPVEGEDSVEVQSQAAAVEGHNAQFLPLRQWRENSCCLDINELQ